MAESERLAASFRSIFNRVYGIGNRCLRQSSSLPAFLREIRAFCVATRRRKCAFHAMIWVMTYAIDRRQRVSAWEDDLLPDRMLYQLLIEEVLRDPEFNHGASLQKLFIDVHVVYSHAT